MKEINLIDTHWLRIEVESLQDRAVHALARSVESGLRPAGTARVTAATELLMCPILTVVDRPLARPFVFLSRRRVLVTLYNLKGFCSYIEMRQSDYLELSMLLALTQLRTLALNPLIEPEDLHCQCSDFCIFAERASFQEYALAYEKLVLCNGCREFYLSLGAENEIVALLSSIGELYSTSD